METGIFFVKELLERKPSCEGMGVKSRPYKIISLITIVLLSLRWEKQQTSTSFPSKNVLHSLCLCLVEFVP